VIADVVHGGGTEQGIGERMQGYVGIAMSEQSEFVRYVNTADDAFTAFYEAVNVEAVADAKVHSLSTFASEHIA
jgi:hypothetical protein